MHSTGEILDNPKNPRIKGDLKILNPKNPRNKTLKQADNIVDYMVSKFQSEEHLPFYRRVAWQVSDNTIKRLIGVAFESGARNPRAYFITCIKHESEYYGN